MTFAVCFSCGQQKNGALLACPECGAQPTSEDDIVLSIGLTDHFNDASQVRRLGGLIAAGTSVRLEIEMDRKLREDLRRNGTEGLFARDTNGQEPLSQPQRAVDWKTVRVFISSTFSDMHAERDHLVRVVFPKLRGWCEKRGLDFRDIDLRWGVSREEAEHGRALDICLNEIDGSRPFFVCLLGERYGWVPPGIQSADYDTSEVHHGLSMTHLEVMHAAITPISRRDGSGARASTQAFFYFRERDSVPPDPCQCHPPGLAFAAHRAAYFEDDPDRIRRLRDLKQEIRDRFRGQDCVRTYRGKWIQHATEPDNPDVSPGRLEELSDFGRRVERDLRSAIEGFHHGHIEHVLAASPAERAAAAHRAVSERLLRTYVDRPGLQEQLVRCIEEPRFLLTLVTGPQGCGKSSILSWLAVKWGGGARIACRYVSAGGGDTTAAGLWSGVLEDLFDQGQTDGLPSSIRTPLDYNELRAQWQGTMDSVRSLGRVVVIFDGVERLSSEQMLLLAALLDMPRPESIKIFVSGIVHDATADEFWFRQLKRLECDELKVGDLTVAESTDLIKHFPSVFCKTFSPDQIDLLLENRATRNPLFLSIALEEIRGFGSFDRLEQRLVELPWLQPAADHGQSVVAADLAGCLELLYEQILVRIVGDLPVAARESAALVFGLLACSRDGLTEIGLEELGSVESGSRQEATQWIQVVLRLVRDHLQRRYVAGSVVLDFAHTMFKTVALRRFVQDEQRERSLRRTLADYHGSQPLAPAHPESYPIDYCGEQMGDHVDHLSVRLYDCHNIGSWLWQLIRMGDWHSVFAAISRPEVFQALWELDERQAVTLWEQVQRETGSSMSDAYASIVDEPGRYSMRLLWAVGRLLSENGYPAQAIGIQQELLQRTSGLAPGDTLALSNLAATLQRLGDDDSAIQLLQAQCGRLESEGNGNLATPLLLGLGRILADQDQHVRALSHFRKASLLARQSKVYQDLLGEILIRRALSLGRLGEMDAALRTAIQGVASCRKEQNPKGLAKALRVLALIQEHAGKDEHADRSRREADDIDSSLAG